MSAINKNILASTVVSSVVMGINTGKKTSLANNIYQSYSAATSKKWYPQPGEKRFIMDWDMNKNELEFE